MAYFIYLITGLIAGIVGGLLGTGGCALMMPVIRFGFHFDPAIAVGTTLTAVVFTAASGAYQHIKMKNVDKHTAWMIAVCGVLGVIIGSVVFDQVKNYGKVIDLILGIAFFGVFLRMVSERFSSKESEIYPENRFSGKKTTKGIFGSCVGFLTGIIGLGGGYALVPFFIFLKMPLKLAIGTSMASFVWIAFVGAMFKIYQGVANIPVAIFMGIGAFVGAMYGAKLVARVHPNALKSLFSLLFLYVSLKYIFIYFGISI